MTNKEIQKVLSNECNAHCIAINGGIDTGLWDSTTLTGDELWQTDVYLTGLPEYSHIELSAGLEWRIVFASGRSALFCVSRPANSATYKKLIKYVAEKKAASGAAGCPTFDLYDSWVMDLKKYRSGVLGGLAPLAGVDPAFKESFAEITKITPKMYGEYKNFTLTFPELTEDMDVMNRFVRQARRDLYALTGFWGESTYCDIFTVILYSMGISTTSNERLYEKIFRDMRASYGGQIDFKCAKFNLSIFDRMIAAFQKLTMEAITDLPDTPNRKTLKDTIAGMYDFTLGSNVAQYITWTLYGVVSVTEIEDVTSHFEPCILQMLVSKAHSTIIEDVNREMVALVKEHSPQFTKIERGDRTIGFLLNGHSY